jgi:hypothetical protein
LQPLLVMLLLLLLLLQLLPLLLLLLFQHATVLGLTYEPLSGVTMVIRKPWPETGVVTVYRACMSTVCELYVLATVGVSC